MNLSIIAPNGKLFNGQVDSVKLPSPLGRFQVCANHAPILARLIAGEITYRIGDTTSLISIKNGFTSIADNEVMVVCEPLE